jgi:hypothetical protein
VLYRRGDPRNATRRSTLGGRVVTTTGASFFNQILQYLQGLF